MLTDCSSDYISLLKIMHYRLNVQLHHCGVYWPMVTFPLAFFCSFNSKLVNPQQRSHVQVLSGMGDSIVLADTTTLGGLGKCLPVLLKMGGGGADAGGGGLVCPRGAGWPAWSVDSLSRCSSTARPCHCSPLLCLVLSPRLVRQPPSLTKAGLCRCSLEALRRKPKD